MKSNQRGVALVEFAIAGPVALFVLFACLEIGRALFVWNTIVEGTQRGARVAAVVDPVSGATTIKNAVIGFGGLSELSAANVQVTYYDSAGAQVTNLTQVTTMNFVKVEIGGVTVSHLFFIPSFSWLGMSALRSKTIPAFSTTVPTESLGIPGP